MVPRSTWALDRMSEQETREYWQSMTHEEKLFFVVANGDAASFSYGRLQMHSEILFVVHAKIDEKFIRKGVAG